MSALSRLLATPPTRGSIVVTNVNGQPRPPLPPIYSERLRSLCGEVKAMHRGGSRDWARARVLADEVRP